MSQLEHVGIAIPDPELLSLFEDILGLRVYKSEAVASENVVTYFIRAGSTKLEFVHPTDTASPVARFLVRRGPGVHHLAFEVDDIEAVFQAAKRRGLRLASTEISDGADGKRVFFLHPKSAGGVLVEFCQCSYPVGRTRSILVGSETFEIRTAGLEDAPGLLLLVDEPDEAVGTELQHHFEAFMNTTLLVGGGNVPSAEALMRAGVPVDSVVCVGSSGASFLAASRGGEPSRSVLFFPPVELLRDESQPDGLLLVVAEPEAVMSRAARRNALVLPAVDELAVADVIRMTLPVVERHLDVVRGRHGEPGADPASPQPGSARLNRA